MSLKAGFIVVNLIFIGTVAWAYPRTPNPELTQGDLCSENDPDFEARKYPERITVCDRNVSRDLKRQIYREYNIPEACRRHYTVDHFIPLSIGGNNARLNLWPEHKLVKERRKDLEQDVFDAVFAGTMKQEEAIARITDAKLHPDPEVLAEIFSGGDCDTPTR